MGGFWLNKKRILLSLSTLVRNLIVYIHDVPLPDFGVFCYTTKTTFERTHVPPKQVPSRGYFAAAPLNTAQDDCDWFKEMPINQSTFFSQPGMLCGLARPSYAALWRKVWQNETTENITVADLNVVKLSQTKLLG